MNSPVIISDDDLVFMITEKCNSNCIMCPMSLDSRKRGNCFTDEEWATAISTLPEVAPHITITGGEPFLDFEHLFPLLNCLKSRYSNIPKLLLTNGRALSVNTIWESFSPLIDSTMRFAIPIHGPNPKIHDYISQTKGSFIQSMLGLQRLKKTAAEIEIRIVGSKLNKDYLSDTCFMLAQSGLRISRVNLVAMEMHGCAAANRNIVWEDYEKIFTAAEKGLQKLMCSGIDVGLYNFPLCSIPKSVWALARDSISREKVRYLEECNECAIKDACGGLFSSTMSLKLFKPNPFR